MTTLDDAWGWYSAVKTLARLTGRLAAKHWDDLGWDGPLGRDQYVATLDSVQLTAQADSVTGGLDDLAVLVLFSVFEATVREAVLAEVKQEAEKLTHAYLQHAAKEACDQIEHGSFFRVLEPYKRPAVADLVEQVNQVRRYRNWVAHGRRGPPPVGVTPEVAYDRLRQFLALIHPPAPEPE